MSCRLVRVSVFAFFVSGFSHLFSFLLSSFHSLHMPTCLSALASPKLRRLHQVSRLGHTVEGPGRRPRSGGSLDRSHGARSPSSVSTSNVLRSCQVVCYWRKRRRATTWRIVVVDHDTPKTRTRWLLTSAPAAWLAQADALTIIFRCASRGF